MTRAFWPWPEVWLRGEQLLGRALEDHGDLGDAPAEALAGAQVERHARPAARVDLERDRGVGLGRRLGVHPVLFEEAERPSRRPATRRRTGRARSSGARSFGQRDGREHLLLLGAEVLRVEGDRLLHGGERQQLQQVVLDDVARGADAVVVAGAAADADVFGHRDLHVVDVVARSRSARTARSRSAAPGCSGPSPCRGSGRCGRSSRSGTPSAARR